MDKGLQNKNSFHLAGVIPVAGQKLDFNLPWHDSLQPIGKDYLAVERAVWECAWAGCETVWIVCHGDMQPLIRYRLGDYVCDPIYDENNRFSGIEKQIPIYYVPVHPKDRDRRDCLGWSVLYGALTAHWLSRTISKWVVPDKFYVSFPYGIYDPEIVRAHRNIISSKNPFFVSFDDKTIKDNEYLGFTFDAEDFKACRKIFRNEGTGISIGYKQGQLPIEKRWSARFFKLDKIFKPVKIDSSVILEAPWYYNIDSWSGLCNFLGSEECTALKRPKKSLLGYHEWNPIGIDNEEK